VHTDISLGESFAVIRYSAPEKHVEQEAAAKHNASSKIPP